VIEESCPILLAQPAGEVERCREAANITRFNLDIPGASLSFDISVNRERAGLSDMVPLARAVVSRIDEEIIGSTEQAGGAIACKKSCCECCSYLVSLSIPEVFRLQQDVQDMPVRQQEAVLRLSIESARRILERRPSRSIGEGLSRTDTRITANRVSRWYGRLGLPCVFLSDDACDFYSNRPLVCREHLVQGSSESCALRSSEMPQVVDRPVSVVEALAQLTAELENSPVESIMLPFALAWAKDNVKRSERTWPAMLMVERFFAILSDMTSASLAPDAMLA